MSLVDTLHSSLDPLGEGLAHFGAAEPDHAQAVYWFRVAADAGDTEGLALLAYCQLEGLGLPRDAVQARARLETAAAHGSLSAQFHLGRMLVAGWGGAPDAERGVALYTAAASLGHADATFNLACCLEAGWGCQPDRLAAKALFLRARALGSPLKAPGLRIRRRELDAVRDLARRMELASELVRALEERQQEIALMHDLAHHPARQAMLTRQRRRQLVLRAASLAALATGLAAVLAGLVASLFGARAGDGLTHDAGPTSIA